MLSDAGLGCIKPCIPLTSLLMYPHFPKIHQILLGHGAAGAGAGCCAVCGSGCGGGCNAVGAGCALGCAGAICCNGCGATASDVPKVALAGPHLEFGKSKSVLLATIYTLEIICTHIWV